MCICEKGALVRLMFLVSRRTWLSPWAPKGQLPISGVDTFAEALCTGLKSDSSFRRDPTHPNITYWDLAAGPDDTQIATPFGNRKTPSLCIESCRVPPQKRYAFAATQRQIKERKRTILRGRHNSSCRSIVLWIGPSGNRRIFPPQ